MRRRCLLILLVILVLSGCGRKQLNKNLVLSDSEVTPSTSDDGALQISHSDSIKEVLIPTLIATPIPTFSRDTTSFWMNGKEFDMQNIDPNINAITNYSWLKNSVAKEQYLFLNCHINPNVEYGALFDIEKMDFVFGAYGTGFTFKLDEAESLVYVFDNCIYNYWGDIIYHNTDTDYDIYELNYSLNLNYNAVNITLSQIDSEKQIEVTCLNYHTASGVFPELDQLQRKETETLAEFDADLNHDGSNEKLNLYKVENGGDLAFLEHTDSKGDSIRLEYAHTSHIGWNSVYLCSMNKKDYLLVFKPYQSTESADFTYEVYYLERRNKLHLIDSGFYSFSYGAKEGENNAFNEESFRIFAEKVNIYLSNSVLLMSTEDGTLRYSTKSKHDSFAKRYETDLWIAEIKKNLF